MIAHDFKYELPKLGPDDMLDPPIVHELIPHGWVRIVCQRKFSFFHNYTINWGMMTHCKWEVIVTYNDPGSIMFWVQYQDHKRQLGITIPITRFTDHFVIIAADRIRFREEIKNSINSIRPPSLAFINFVLETLT